MVDKTQEITTIGGEAGAILAALHGTGTSSIDVPQPFAEPILIVEETRVAGTSHVEDIDLIAEELNEGDTLRLERESANRYDRWAIRVFDPKGRAIGYVSADVNEIPARLMDGGKKLFGKLGSVEQLGRWFKMEMAVYLDD